MESVAARTMYEHMKVTRSYTKVLPLTEQAVLQLGPLPVSGIIASLENMDASMPFNYKWQDSNDGSTWTDIAFRTGVGDATAVTFTVQAATVHEVKVTSSKQNVRLMAVSGGNIAEITIAYTIPHSTSGLVTFHAN